MPHLFLFLLALLFLPIHANAQNSGAGCAKHKDFRSRVVFNVNIGTTRYDNRRNSRYLTHKGRESLKSWRRTNEKNVWVSGTDDDAWHTQGLTRGAVKMRTHTNLVGKPYDKYGIYFCPYVRQIVVDIDYASEIYVANEHKQGSCLYNEILAHEERHHDTNVTVVKTLAKRMEADMPKIINMMEGQYISRSHIDKSFDKLKQSVSDALDIYLEEISLRRDEFNAHVDTPEEYKRLSEVCQ